MKKLLKRIGIDLLVVVLLSCAITYIPFTQWRNDVTKDLVRDSTVVQTAKGPIEYAEIGHGPPVLLTHGDPGGYDQVYQVVKLEGAERGVSRYIIPSRPTDHRCLLARTCE
jgi:hypothetical protein